MAARTLRPKHQDEIRTKIQTSQLINRLQNHALSDGDDEINSSRMKAIEILLRKSLPDLSSVMLTGDAENPIQLGVSVEFVNGSSEVSK